MRWPYPSVLLLALILSLGVVAYTQRSGPTPEDKTLAARLIQEALRDTLGISDPAARALKAGHVHSAAQGRDD